MQPSDIFYRLFTFLLPPAIIGTAYLYFYPIFQNCSFPEAKHAEAACYFGDKVKHAIPGETAPFRLLALADPQLEGDTSIPSADGWDVVPLIQRYRKQLDLWGNDLYLAHVYRSMRWFTDPTHVVVLGDLVGSQWIGDEEFESRAERFWGRVFRGGKKVPTSVTGTSSQKAEVLGMDAEWKKRIIAVAGNHDVGYSGDLDAERLKRFEDKFGKVNWEVTFKLNETTGSKSSGFGRGLEPSSPELRLVVLNSMNLDSPAKDMDLQEETRTFLNDKLYFDLPSEDTGTVILTHIPLHKEAGICADGPFVEHFSRKLGGGIKEQNHLSTDMSDVLLGGLVGPELTRKGIILNGHDHEGCETYHYKPKEIDLDGLLDETKTIEDRWFAKTYHSAGPEVLNSSLTGAREVTVRSMMGSYGGNAGLLSGWWDRETKEWKFDYSICFCGVQHIWWGVHVLDIVVIGLGLAFVAASVLEVLLEIRQQESEEARKKKTS